MNPYDHTPSSMVTEAGPRDLRSEHLANQGLSRAPRSYGTRTTIDAPVTPRPYKVLMFFGWVSIIGILVGTTAVLMGY